MFFKLRSIYCRFQKIILSSHKLIKEMEKNLQIEKKEHKQKGITSQQFQQLGKGDPSLPTDLQKRHVYQVYDKIAPHFSHTRYKPWPKIEKFLNQLDRGSLVYDVGCGNGKYMNVNPELFMFGTDRSVGLLKTAQEKFQSNQIFAADSLSLPLRAEACDAFISIAVIHHFSTEEQRLRAVRQMVRVTRIGGLGLIYVWAYEQDIEGQQSISKRKFDKQDVFVPWHLHFKYESDLQNIDHEGCEIDYEKKSVVYKRFYHVFKKGELQSLLEQIKQIEILGTYYDKQNWCCKIRKIK